MSHESRSEFSLLVAHCSLLVVTMTTFVKAAHGAAGQRQA
jgi:hypothetical protein